MRVDQVAVDLYWQDSGRTRQVIRGLRKKELLPVKDFNYYIDRLTAVQNGYGDQIAIGEGRDVRGVPHPLGPDAELVYDYRIADSVQVDVASMGRPIRVYEVEVRPRNADLPAFVGSVFLDAASGALTKMVFTFTPSSYVDPRVDRVDVTLEHALWEGRHWLPYRQVVEVRREIPEVDLPVGSMIRATLKVAEYEFDPELEADFFRGPAVTSVAYGTDSTEFRSGLMERMAEEGLSPVSMAQLEAEARRTVRARLVSGLPQVRLYTDRVSSIVRANRAEGLFVGLGASFAPHEALKVEGLTGMALGNDRVSMDVRGQWSVGTERNTSITVGLYGRQVRDLGPREGAAGAVNTLSTLFGDEDHTDLHFASGTRVSVARGLGSTSTVWAAGTWEHLTGAEQVWRGAPFGGRTLRPVWDADEGTYAALSGGFQHRWGGFAAWGASLGMAATAGRWKGQGVGKATARLDGRLAARDLSRQLSVTVEAGRAWGLLPRQLLFFVGGQGTLPGHGYRQYGGKRFLLINGEAALTVLPGWLTARVLGGVGGVGATPSHLVDTWGTGPSDGVRGYLGLGIGTFHDLLRLDGAWALDGGSFELMISVDPRLGPYL